MSDLRMFSSTTLMMATTAHIQARKRKKNQSEEDFTLSESLLLSALKKGINRKTTHVRQ